MDKNLNIICFTVPYPVDYGGVFDLFYKLHALQQAGVSIHLHCFDYGRGKQPELYKYCASVHYYSRSTTPYALFSKNLPYIVRSRKNEQLIKNLLQNDYPIFMEGIHCTYILNDHRFKNRKTFVRVHNVEYLYYRHLYENVPISIKKLYYYRESLLLKKYETYISDKATAFWGVTEMDVEYYRKNFGCKTIDFLSLYLPPQWKVNALPGMGRYCLYQGDLSVELNEKAAIWLLDNVFSNIKTPFVIAGKNPGKKLIEKAHNRPNTCLIENPGEQEMQDMIAKAHIHLIPSFHKTGIKLKLLNALFNGRHIIVNEATVLGSHLEPLCHICDSASSFIECIEHLFTKPVEEEEINNRKKMIEGLFDNKANAQQQVKWIWG